MSIVYLIINILQTILWVYLGISGLYLFIFAFAGLFPSRKDYSDVPDFRRIAVLIPAYKEDNVIVDVARKALEQDYPNEFYDIYVIADSLQPSTIRELKQLPIQVIEVKFEKSTKAKALNAAMEQMSSNYDICVILDADNVMAPDFLRKTNQCFHGDVVTVQGHRIAKNMNTPFAILDAISEEINNHIFRKGHRRLGLSAAIIGSGVAFDFKFFKNLIPTIKAIGGFDKEIEVELLRKGYKIYYRHDAIVYDEKVQKPEVFHHQRRRWLSAQLHYFGKYFSDSVYSLFKHGNIEYFNKTFQFLQLPRVLILAGTFVFTIIFVIINLLMKQKIASLLWLGLFVVIVLDVAISIPKRFFNKNMLLALKYLPQGIVLMTLSLFRTKGANQQFIHTVHGTADNLTSHKN